MRKKLVKHEKGIKPCLAMLANTAMYFYTCTIGRGVCGNELFDIALCCVHESSPVSWAYSDRKSSSGPAGMMSEGLMLA